jgi:hypothetical protein
MNQMEIARRQMYTAERIEEGRYGRGYGRASSGGAKSKWMSDFSDHVTRLSPAHAGRINWDSATFHYNQGHSPEEAAKRFVGSEKPKTSPFEQPMHLR